MPEAYLEKELADHLETLGYGKVEGVGVRKPTIFWGEQPPEPQKCITVIEEQGGPPQDVIGQTYSVTILVRDTEYKLARETMQSIYRALHGEQGILSTIKVARITADSQPLNLGVDGGSNDSLQQTYTVVAKNTVLP